MVESLLFASICLCDLILTLWLLQTGAAIEANPILRFYYELGVQWFALVKGAFSLVPIFVLEVIALRRRRFVQNLLRAGIVLYVAIFCLGAVLVNT